MDLQSKVALIVRADQPLGAGIAAALTEAGACVVHSSAVDSLADASELVDSCVRAQGRIDIMVILPQAFPHAPFMELSEDDWQRALDANVAGSLYAAQAAARRMVEQGEGGRIIFVSSVTSEMAFHETSLMGATLAAANTIAQVAAMELGQYGITVNSVAPGWSETPDGPVFAAPFVTDEAGRAAIAANVPLGRLASPLEIGQVCAFLASPAASYVSGAYLKVDGGYAISKGEGGTPFPGQQPWPSFDSGYDPLNAPF